MIKLQAADNARNWEPYLFCLSLDVGNERFAAGLVFSDVEIGIAFAVDGVGDSAAVVAHRDIADIPFGVVNNACLEIGSGPVVSGSILLLHLGESGEFAALIMRKHNSVGDEVGVAIFRRAGMRGQRYRCIMSLCVDQIEIVIEA